MKKLLLALSLISVLTYCKKGGDEEYTPKEIQNASYGFETDFEDWMNQGGSGERKFETDIVITDELASEGTYSCKFTISPESYVGKGNRAELTFDQNAVEGDEVWYEYSVYIPTDFQDSPVKHTDGTPNWHILGQWHQQPVWQDGEDWDNFTSAGESPPLAVYYNYFSMDDPGYTEILQDPSIDNIVGVDKTWDKVSTLTISQNSEPVAITKIEKGEWIHLKFNIRWSQGNDGYVQVWKNGEDITNGKIYGKNMLNKASHYFKFGLYRNPNIPYTHHLYYDNVKIYTK